MAKVGVVTGLWSGSVGITSMILPSFAEAVEHVESIFKQYPTVLEKVKEVEGWKKFLLNERALQEETGETYQHTYDGKVHTYKLVPGSDGERVEIDVAEIGDKHVEEIGITIESKFFKHFFTDYYGGCGACYAILVEEIGFGEVFREFNFD